MRWHDWFLVSATAVNIASAVLNVREMWLRRQRRRGLL